MRVVPHYPRKCVCDYVCSLISTLLPDVWPYCIWVAMVMFVVVFMGSSMLCDMESLVDDPVGFLVVGSRIDTGG